MVCGYYFSEICKEKGMTSKLIVEELKGLYFNNKKKCESLVSFYLNNSNNEDILTAIDNFKKEYEL